MKEVFVERLTLRPTLACNFRCKLCNEYSPYYDSPKIPSLEELERDVDRTFSLIDRISRFEISGGEPLLFKQLPALLEHINRYNDRFELFSMVTNGSIKFSDEMLAALKAIGIKVRVIVDDYGPELSKNARLNAQMLNDAGIRYELRDQFENIHSDGWLDFSDLSLKHSVDEAKAMFAKCVCPQKLHWVVTLHNGHLYPCHVARRCVELGLIDEKPTECIDIHSTTLSDEELRRNIMGLYELDVLTACRHCDGFIETRERKIPAEQLPKRTTI